MGQPAARLGDIHTCPLFTGLVPHVGGPIALGSPNVITGGMPQARVADICVCVGPPDVIVQGSMTVLVNGFPAARIGDLTAHGGAIVTGLPTVLIGDSSGAPSGGVGMSAEAGDIGELISSGPGMPMQMLQAQALKDAAKSGTPFCARCAAGAAAPEAHGEG